MMSQQTRANARVKTMWNNRALPGIVTTHLERARILRRVMIMSVVRRISFSTVYAR